MAYSNLISRSTHSLFALSIGLTLACNPDKGDDTSASESASASSSSGEQPTTTHTTESSSTGEHTTGVIDSTSTGGSESSSTGETGETTGGAVGCAEDPDFTASWNAWQSAVATQGDTYYYTVTRGRGGLMPPDYCIHRTMIVVVDGKVVERRFEVAETVGEPECDAPFIEKGEEVGTNTVGLAAVPATVEVLYAACCDEVLHIEPAEEYMITFTTDEQGLMNQCYYVANSCADGCDSGPLGASLAFESLAFGAAPPAP